MHRRAVVASADKTTSSEISEDEQDKIVDRKTASDSTEYSKCQSLFISHFLTWKFRSSTIFMN